MTPDVELTVVWTGVLEVAAIKARQRHAMPGPAVLRTPHPRPRGWMTEWVLAALAGGDYLTVSEIAGRLGRGQADTNSALCGMCTRGLVEREYARPADQRHAGGRFVSPQRYRLRRTA